MARARILDADHTGLDDVKDRIVEFLAVRKLRAERGLSDTTSPPRVGAARARSSRWSVRPASARRRWVSRSRAPWAASSCASPLGGVRDEAEIRGHRRTYVGCAPGRIVRALTEAGTMNPVILLDEVDKLGNDWRGDPSSALLEVLDPAQNHTFRDHYLEVDLDLSDVLFLATANVLDTIPGPLLDRMEIVRLDGYTEDEKVAIATRPPARPSARAQRADAPTRCRSPTTRSARVVTDYTREAGVRNLERELGKLLRKAAARIASGTATPPITVDVDDVQPALGRAKFHSEAAERTGVPGVATGLAVTGAGGDVLFIEATTMDGEPA